LNKILARGGVEFLAVLFGITISLWVEESRENIAVQNRITEDYYYINQEIEIDIKNIENIILAVNTQITSLKTLLNFNENKINFNDNDVIVNLKKITSPTFYGTQTAYTASVSSGRLNSSKNLNLSNEIALLYEHFYKRLNANSQLYDFRNQKLKSDYFMDFFSITVGGHRINDLTKEIFMSVETRNALYWMLEFVENFYIFRLEDTKNQMEKTKLLISSFLTKNNK
jgi:hypothetical protein|tara:strand:+ start:196 stop:876 length:681 start_codon:yes stop_codon:yes gene_type:complete